MIFSDRVDLVGTRITSDGYLVADARIARSGIYEYAGREVGRPDLPRVRVYRSDAEVFSDAAMSSFAHRPITNDHPPEGVTADNWTKVAVGYSGDQVARDGGFVRVPMMIADAGAIRDLQNGKNELSAGYVADFAFEAGTAPDGTAYDAVQRNIRGNHVAIVSKGRAGPDCRVGDGATEPDPDDAEAIKQLKAAIALHTKHMNGTAPMTGKAGEASQMKMMTQMKAALAALTSEDPSATPSKGNMKMDLKTITVDGLPVETTDAGIAAINKLTGTITTLTAARDAASTQVGTLTATVSTKDGEIAALKAQLADAAMTPAKLDAAVTARAAVVADARKFAGAALVVDGKSDVEIKRAAVGVKLGDATVASMDDAGIAGAFTAFVGVPSAGAVDTMRHVLGDTQVVGDAAASDAALKAENARLAGNWQGNKAA